MATNNPIVPIDTNEQLLGYADVYLKLFLSTMTTMTQSDVTRVANEFRESPAVQSIARRRLREKHIAITNIPPRYPLVMIVL